MSFLGMGTRIFREIWASRTFFQIWGLGQNLIGEHTTFEAVLMCLIMLCHIGVWLGTKVILALRMLASYMYFDGTGIWGDETMTNFTLKKSKMAASQPFKKFFFALLRKSCMIADLSTSLSSYFTYM